jgi:type I restriction enzyme R subunit/putative DNA methylase
LESLSCEEVDKPKLWHSRGYLPHFDAPGMIQHVTFHLGDSLPREAITRMQCELDSMPDEQQAIQRRRRIQVLLDSGMGSCVLLHGKCAKIVEDALLFGDDERYRLLAWAIMPNHVHVLIEQAKGWSLSKVVQSWKRHAARQIHLLGLPSCARQGSDPLWQRDYWDRFIRDEGHFLTTKKYIEDNPVMAGLCTVAAGWRWGSARLGGGPSTTRQLLK